MSAIVLDTHALVWYLGDSSRISAPAHAAIKNALAAGSDLVVPSISLAEILYLEEKGRLPNSTLGRIVAEIDRPDSVFLEAPFTKDIVAAMRKIPRDLVPELPDRMIAATALHFGLPIVTADAAIHSAPVTVIW